MAFTQASLIKDVLADAKARSIIEEHLPGATTHPYIDEALYLTIGEVMSIPQAIVIRKKIQTILVELAALGSAA
jgi:predicted transcriptional regulator